MELIIKIGLHEPKYCNIYGKNFFIGLADIRAKALMKKIMIRYTVADCICSINYKAQGLEHD